MSMVDPSDGMKSFQKELRRGSIGLHVARTDPKMYVHRDSPLGPPEYRFTYVRLQQLTVTALVMFVAQPPQDGYAVFGVGYAVPKRFRNQGRAKDLLRAAIVDMEAGLSRNGVPGLYLEVIVDIENTASRKVAEAVIGGAAEEIVEGKSGKPALKYIRKFTAASAG